MSAADHWAEYGPGSLERPRARGCATDAPGLDDVLMGASLAVVLHLAEQALDEGRLAGEVEIVATGVRTLVRDAEELVIFLQCHRPPPAAAGEL